MALRLSRTTGCGEFLTLAGAGIIIDLISQAINQVRADPNDVVLRIHDGSRGATIDVMFPTPHTFLFDGVHINKGNICFISGGRSQENREYELPLANPDVVGELVKVIEIRAKTHRKTKAALNC